MRLERDLWPLGALIGAVSIMAISGAAVADPRTLRW
jgi:hypothetical protein